MACQPDGPSVTLCFVILKDTTMQITPPTCVKVKNQAYKLKYLHWTLITFVLTAKTLICADSLLMVPHQYNDKPSAV